MFEHIVLREKFLVQYFQQVVVKSSQEIYEGNRDIELAVNEVGRIVVSGKIYCFLMI